MDLTTSTPIHISIETVAWMAVQSNIDFNMSSSSSCHVMHVKSNHIWIYRRFAFKEKNHICRTIKFLSVTYRQVYHFTIKFENRILSALLKISHHGQVNPTRDQQKFANNQTQVTPGQFTMCGVVQLTQRVPCSPKKIKESNLIRNETLWAHRNGHGWAFANHMLPKNFCEWL